MSEPVHPPKPTRVTIFRLLLGIAIGLVILLAGSELAPRLPGAERWILEQGFWGPVYFVGLLCVLTLLCVPLDLMLVAGGMMFPLGRGFLIIAVGLYLSQSLIFWVSRLFLHERVQRWISRKPKLVHLNRAIDREGLKLLMLIRLAPIPASPVSYLMGAGTMSFWRFCVANLGLLPVAFVSQYVGYAAVHATRDTYTPHHTLSLQDLSLYGGLLIALVVVGMVGHLAHKTLKDVEENA